MTKEIPKFYETFKPILETLRIEDNISRAKLREKVIKKYYDEIPKELLTQRIKSGDILIHNRLNWGISYLKQAGYLAHPKRGYVQLTEKGNKASTEISLNQIKSDIYSLNPYKEKVETSSVDEIKTETPEDLINEGFSQIENEVKNDLLDKLKTMDPYYFEKVILILLKKMGYGDFIETSKSADGGIDGIINEDKLGLDKIYIQAKRFAENKVREKDIRNFIGAMSGDTNKGVFVTTSQFDKGAEEKAKNAHHKIILIDGNKLADLMYEYTVGVQIKSVYEIKHLDEDFFVEE
ncbi:restriction endonuclease [Flavobacterium tistrianum]|uniref:restriction endonuclease n=1 Tax=Flavobacterium tistrianum TaxID=1685414 RepID=UPI000DAD1B5C|nr:restriction endonuclease [Flavobacterium tistrianum]KAF2338417.1 restriction endonuclease [Flavobacterium tistrianum]